MSLFDRRSLLLALLALPAAACGFTPVYAPGSGAAALRGAVQVGTPDSANAFALTRALGQRFGPVTAQRYTLSVQVQIKEEGGVITPTSEIDRFTLLGGATFTLIEDDTGATAADGSLRAFTSYSASGTPVATRAARVDAQERLMVILADQIVTALVSAAP